MPVGGVVIPLIGLTKTNLGRTSPKTTALFCSGGEPNNLAEATFLSKTSDMPTLAVAAARS